MKVFPFNEEIDETINQLTARILKIRNGEIREQMQRAGTAYKKNWGVSVVHLENIASELERDQELARRLYIISAVKEVARYASKCGEAYEYHPDRNEFVHKLASGHGMIDYLSWYEFSS